MTTKIKLGVSSCLLGERVRYDGGHKHDHYITDTLGAYFTYVSVCPEEGCGLPTPRESMRLEGDSANPRIMTRKSRVDITEQMQVFCSTKTIALEHEDLCGFIFKKDSPSSGLYRVKVYNNGIAVKNGSGLFATAMARHFPLLPMEEEGRLNDMGIRENFIERVFSYRRWKDFMSNKPTIGKLVEFHTKQKLLLMAHSPTIYREMGTLVALGNEITEDELFKRYELLFMKGLSLFATTSKHTNVLQHVMGYFKKQLTKDEKSEMLELIDQYHSNILPLIVPLTLLKHYIKKYDQKYLKDQVYLSPHPAQLMLRNHC